MSPIEDNTESAKESRRLSDEIGDIVEFNTNFDSDEVLDVTLDGAYTLEQLRDIITAYERLVGDEE